MMFFLFAVSVSWILVNVMLTIIIDGYEEVKKELEGQKNDLEVIQYIKVTTWFIIRQRITSYMSRLSRVTCQDCLRSMAGYQERPHFLLEFAPGGSRHEELVVDRAEEEIQSEVTSSMVNELPTKVDEFLEVRQTLSSTTLVDYSNFSM